MSQQQQQQPGDYTTPTDQTLPPPSQQQQSQLPLSSSTQDLMPTSNTEYLQSHQIHYVLDKMIKDILVEKPQDSSSWMLRWFMEKHRAMCEVRHNETSPLHKPRRNSEANVKDDAVGGSKAPSSTSARTPTPVSTLDLGEAAQHGATPKDGEVQQQHAPSERSDC